MVSDGARLAQTEQREARLPQPRSVPQLMRALNKARRNNTLYVKLLGSDAGAVVNGELLRRCRHRSWPSSKRTAAAATSTRCTAPRSANGSCRPITPSAACGR